MYSLFEVENFVKSFCEQLSIISDAIKHRKVSAFISPCLMYLFGALHSKD